jgi:glycosyltransferase involved in cell wall biosynthesis/spore maturation protein CgeB
MSNNASNSSYRVLLLDTKVHNPNHYICLAIQRALQEIPCIEIVVKSDLSNAISEAIQQNCNLFFAFDGEALDHNICARVAAICGLSMLWVTEDPYELSVNIVNSNIFDLVFTNDSSCVDAYGKKGRHLPLAGVMDFHFIPIQYNLDALRYDLFFAGTAWPNRVKLVNQLLDESLGGRSIKAKIALPTNEHLPAVNLSLPKSQYNWRTSPIDFARFANLSLTTLVLPRIFSSSGNREFAETPPPRLFEAALAGTVQLVQSNLVEAELYFEEGKDFLYFDSAENLIDKVNLLRKDISWRNQIAKSAQDKALTQHCYKHRMEYALKELTSLENTLNPSDGKLVTRPRVLFIVHNVIGNGNFGGVEVYLKQISSVMGNDFEFYFYVPNRLNASLSNLLLDQEGIIIQEYVFSSQPSSWDLSCEQREGVFSEILRKFKISVVHFQHLIGHVPSLVEIAKAVGVPTVMTFHDYHQVCHNFTLRSFKGTYCHPDEISLSQCDVCLFDVYKILPGAQATRRAYFDNILAKVDQLIFNTQGCFELTAKIYPAVNKHSQVTILPVPLNQTVVPSADNALKPGHLKVAILGNFIPHKGSNTILRAIPLLMPYNIEFHVFGNLIEEYKWVPEAKDYQAMRFYGGYQPGKLPPELYSCHVSLHLSDWPETYCLTLSEAWDSGLIPVVTDIGALGERVTDGVNGLKIPPDSEGALVQALLRLYESPKLLRELRKNLGSAPISRCDDHVSGLNKIYSSLAKSYQVATEIQTTSSTITLSKLGNPVILKWANFSVFNSVEQVNQNMTRLLFIDIGLINRGLRHLRVYGFKSFWATLTHIARSKF